MQGKVTGVLHPLVGCDCPLAKIKIYGGVQVNKVKMDGRSLAQQELREPRADFVDQPLSWKAIPAEQKSTITVAAWVGDHGDTAIAASEEILREVEMIRMFCTIQM